MRFSKALPWIVLASVLAVAVLGMLAQSMASLFILGGVSILVCVFPRPWFLLAIAVALSGSDLVLPGMPAQLTFYHIAAALFCASAALIRSSRPQGEAMKLPPKMLFCLWGFVAVMGITAAFRGAGMKILGSDTWGGRPYVSLLLAAGLLFQSRLTTLSANQCKWALYGLCLLGLLPTLAEAARDYAGTPVLMAFIARAEEDNAFDASMMGSLGPMFRLQVANVAATYLFLLMILLLHRRRAWNHIGTALCAVAGIVLTGISGHRISLIYGAVLLAAYLVVNVRRSLARRFVNVYSVGALLAGGLLILLSPHLPLMFQRAMTWIPFVDVSQEARLDADVTALWRLDVWRATWQEIPKYLLLGKGFAFSRGEMMSYVQWTMNNIDFVITSRNYHNGVLQVLIDLGVPGLVFAVGFVIAVLKWHFRQLSRPWRDASLRHLHHTMFASFIAQVIVYLISAGGAMTFVTLFIWTLMMNQLVRSDEGLPAEAAGSAVPA